MDLNEIIQKLQETRDVLLTTLNGLNTDQLNKPKELNSWSIGQVCQHLVKTEELYMLAIKKSLKSKVDSSIGNKPIEFLLDRTKKLEAPEIAKPTDEIVEYEEILEILKTTRENLYEMLDALEDPSILSRREFTHPVFKEMLLIEWVRSLELHEQRHTKQIIEIKDAL